MYVFKMVGGKVHCGVHDYLMKFVSFFQIFLFFYHFNFFKCVFYWTILIHMNNKMASVCAMIIPLNPIQFGYLMLLFFYTIVCLLNLIKNSILYFSYCIGMCHFFGTFVTSVCLSTYVHLCMIVESTFRYILFSL